MKKYLLNLTKQMNGDYELHHNDCYWKPVYNFQDIGRFNTFQEAFRHAQNLYADKQINACKYCLEQYHIKQ